MLSYIKHIGIKWCAMMLMGTILCGYLLLLKATMQQPVKKIIKDTDTIRGVHAFNLPLEDGTELPLAQYKGKVLLIVNTAAHCTFTPQYRELEELYQAYKDKGLVIIGVSSNDFNQEITDAQERTCFLEDHYAITFPVTSTVSVNSIKTHRLYQWLNAEAGFFGAVKWNFHKFLMGKDGRFIDWFAPSTKPNSKKVIKAIEKTITENYV